MTAILRYFTEFGSFGANDVKEVEDRPILCATKMYSKESSMTGGNICRGKRKRMH